MGEEQSSPFVGWVMMPIISEVSHSDIVERGRADAEYYQPTYQILKQRLECCDPDNIGRIAFVTDGIHSSPDVCADGVTYVSAKCVKDNEFVLDDAIKISPLQNEKNPRTQLQLGDVIVTSVGTIGNTAVVDDDVLPANCDRHVGIIRAYGDAEFFPYYLATFMNCRYGRFQSLREAAGNVQLNLYIGNIASIDVPRFGSAAERSVADEAIAGYALRKKSKSLYTQAQQLLESELGLDKLTAKKYTKWQSVQRTEIAGSNRTDPEYYARTLTDIANSMSKANPCHVGGLCTVVNGYPWKSDFFQDHQDGEPVIRIRDIRPGCIENEQLTTLQREYASKVGFPKAVGGDVVVGMDGVRYFYAGLVEDSCYVNQRVAHVKINPDSDVSPEYLMFVLNSKVGQSQLLREMTIATTVGHITNDNIRRLSIPLFDKDTRGRITNLVAGSMAAKKESKQLLAQAKSRVELLIEEAAAKAASA